MTAAAARHGVRTGMTVAQGKSKCAALEVLPWDAAAIAREIARASAAFLAASPQVSPVRDEPGTWWIGAEGFEAIGGERALATQLLALARVWHPRARVAIAESCVTAYAATWSTRAASEPLHVAPGGDRDYLARVPIALIPMDAELREALTALGLRTAGAFAALDPLEVERRWGSDGLSAWRLACADDPRRATLARTDDPRTVVHELASSAPTVEPVLFLVRAALDRLVRTLAADGLAAAALSITLTLDDGRRVTREVRPARPIARVVPLFERCRAALDTWTLEAPVAALELRVSETAPSSAEQGDLLAPAWRDPSAAEAALARLRATLGAGTVVRPVARDSYAPERAAGWTEVEQAARAVPVDALQAMRAGNGTQGNGTQKNGTHASALHANGMRGAHGGTDSARSAPAARLLESPEHIAVVTDKHGVPLQVFWKGRRLALTRAEGPERLSGEWWHAQPFARDYWRCECDELGQDLLIYRDAGGWHLQGWYD